MREREEESSVGNKLTYLLIGGGIGAILALLFAPKSGVELREDIADVTRKGIDKTRETAVLVGERAGDYYEVAKDRAGEYYETGRDKVAEVYETGREKVAEVYETGREKVAEVYETAEEKAKALAAQAREVTSRQTNPISAAIEAGKSAYYEEKRKTESASLTDGRPQYPVDNPLADLIDEKD